MADRVRIQAITENNPETWADVGPDGINLPVDVKDSVLPDGAATSEKQSDGSQKTQVVNSSNINVDFSTEAKQDSILTELQQKTEPNDIQLTEFTNVLRSLLLVLANPPYVDKSANVIRNQVQSGTVTTVTTLTNFGSFPADHLQRMVNMTAWATNIRSLIT